MVRGFRTKWLRPRGNRQCIAASKILSHGLASPTPRLSYLNRVAGCDTSSFPKGNVCSYSENATLADESCVGRRGRGNAEHATMIRRTGINPQKEKKRRRRSKKRKRRISVWKRQRQMPFRPGSDRCISSVGQKNGYLNGNLTCLWPPRGSLPVPSTPYSVVGTEYLIAKTTAEYLLRTVARIQYSFHLPYGLGVRSTYY